MFTKVLQTYRSAYGGLPREVWMISMALFINRFGTMVLPFLMLYLTRELDLGEASAGGLLSVYGFGAIVGTYCGGKLTDQFGAIRLQIVLLLCSVPMFLVLPFCTTWEAIASCLFLLSIFSEGVRPANSTAVAQLAPYELQTRAFALQRMALNLGFSFGPVIGGLLTTISFFWLFVADAVTTGLCAVALLWFFGFKRDLRGAWNKEKTTDEFESNGAAASEKFETSAVYSTPWRDYRFLSFLGLLLVGSIVFFQFQSTYPLYLRDHYGLTNVGIGCVFAVNTLVIIAFEMVLVEYVKRWPLLLTIGWGCFFSCLGFGILPFGTTAIFCIVSMMVLTLGEMLSMPLSSGWVARRSRGGPQGGYMGLYSMNYSIAFMIAPALGGLIYETESIGWSGWRCRGPEFVWYIGMLVGIGVLIGFYVLENVGRPKKR